MVPSFGVLKVPLLVGLHFRDVSMLRNMGPEVRDVQQQLYSLLQQTKAWLVYNVVQVYVKRIWDRRFWRGMFWAVGKNVR
jgi:hypothetical protein